MYVKVRENWGRPSDKPDHRVRPSITSEHLGVHLSDVCMYTFFREETCTQHFWRSKTCGTAVDSGGGSYREQRRRPKVLNYRITTVNDGWWCPYILPLNNEVHCIHQFLREPKSHQVVMNDCTDPNTAVNYLNSPISTDIYRITSNYWPSCTTSALM